MRNTSAIFLLALISTLYVLAPAQDQAPPKPAQHSSQELLWVWNDIGRKLIAMAEDFPEDKYGFKAQKDQRSFGENLLHVAEDEYAMINAMKGSEVGFIGNDDSLRKKYPTKADIVKFVTQVVADGAALIKEQGNDRLTREFKFP
jgi:hypothetical protein